MSLASRDRQSVAYLLPQPDNDIGEGDRRQVSYIFSGWSWVTIVDGIVLSEGLYLGLYWETVTDGFILTGKFPKRYIDPPRQYTILETFSPNTVENIRNIVRVITGTVGDPTQTVTPDRNRQSVAYLLPMPDGTIDENDRQQVACLYAFVFDPAVTKTLSSQIYSKNGKIPDRSYFEITNVGTVITISPGIAVVNGTYVETIADMSLDITNLNNSYIFASLEDVLPTTNGTHYLYVILYHHSTESDQFAYFGLINNYNFYGQYKDYLCRLGILQITVAGGIIVSIDDILEEHPIISGRVIDYINVPGRTCAIADGGVIYD